MRRKMMEKVNRKQVGGNHYEQLSIQPIELYDLLKLDAFQGPILKYLSRHKFKNGLQDLLKAIDYCNISINYNHTPVVKYSSEEVIYKFIPVRDYLDELNSLNEVKTSSPYMVKAILNLIMGKWVQCKDCIKLYTYSEYDIDIDKL